MRVWVALLACVILLAFEVRSAGAEPTAAEVQVARRLFEQATRDEEAGRWEAALQKLRNVERIKVTPGVVFHIAVCEQNLRRYLEALDELGRSEELARERNDGSVLALVPARRAELESKVAQLRVVLRGDATETTVLVDGRELSHAALGLDVPLNPGEHRIIVQRPQGPELVRKVMLEPGQRRTEELDLSFAVEAPSVPVPMSRSESAPRRDDAKSSVAKQIVTYSSYAIALAGVGTGIFFLTEAADHDNAARKDRALIAEQAASLGDTASKHPCSTPYPSLGLEEPCVALHHDIEQRNDARRLAVIGFAIAGAGALGGTAALLFWPTQKEERMTWRVTPMLGGLVASGRF
jgi:hypothetical protein